MGSKNPIFSQKFTENIMTAAEAPMTIQGALNKLLILTMIMAVSGAAVWYQFSLGYMDKVMAWTIGGAIIGFILALIIIFKQNTAPTLAPVYAFAEGAFLGGISSIFEASFPGIVIQAVALTFLTVLSMASLYKLGLIKATERFRATIFTATLAIAIFYVINFILYLFHVPMASVLYSSSVVGIAFSVIVCIIAALNLIIDFDFIEQGALNFMPKQYEWYGAFGLMVTIVWLYVEILRLLSKLRSR